MSLFRSVIIALEDMQWADRDSLTLVGLLTRSLEGYSVNIIATARPNDDGTFTKLDLDSEIKVTEIRLPHLSITAAKRMVRSQFSTSPDANLFDLILTRSGCNPFFIEQLCGYLTESKAVAVQGRFLVLKAEPRDLPATINAVIVARLDRLTEELKQVVQHAAVLGMEFNVEILSKMLRGQPVRYLLGEGERERIWKELDRLLWGFHHALLREAAYELQLKSRLRRLHRIAAESLELIYPEQPDHWADIAYHFEQAQVADRAKEYLWKAAAHAKGHYQNQEALDLYIRLSQKPLSAKERYELRDQQGDVLTLVGEAQQAEALFQENRRWSRERKDTNREFESLLKIALVSESKADYHNLRKVTLDALRVAEDIGDEQMMGRALAFSAIGAWRLTRHREAVSRANHALSLLRKGKDYRAILKAQNVLFAVNLRQGDLDQARAFWEDAEKTAVKIGNKNDLLAVEANKVLISIYSGDSKEGILILQEAQKLAEEVGNKLTHSLILNNFFECYFQLGNYKEAEKCVDRALLLTRQTRNRYVEGRTRVKKGIFLTRVTKHAI